MSESKDTPVETSTVEQVADKNAENGSQSVEEKKDMESSRDQATASKELTSELKSERDAPNDTKCEEGGTNEQDNKKKEEEMDLKDSTTIETSSGQQIDSKDNTCDKTQPLDSAEPKMDESEGQDQKTKEDEPESTQKMVKNEKALEPSKGSDIKAGEDNAEEIEENPLKKQKVADTSDNTTAPATVVS